MSAALQEKVPVLLPAASTIADGIAVRSAGEKTLPLVQKYVYDLVLVEEEEIANSILFLLERERNVAEGAEGSELPRLFTPRLIPTVKRRLSWCRAAMGMSRSWLARIIERGLVKDGRVVRLRIHLPDHPGALNRLTSQRSW
jgi:threonine dehydratase